MLTGGTAHDDGVHVDQLGNRYGVDAGLLSIELINVGIAQLNEMGL